MQNGTATLEDSLAIYTKINILLPDISAITLLGIQVENMSTEKPVVCYSLLETGVYKSFIYNCQNFKVTKRSFSRWVSKWTVIYTDNEILFSAKKKCAMEPWKDMEET